MTGSIVLLHLAGAVALLLWATRMVRSGVEAVFGASLRAGAAQWLANPAIAALTGLFLGLLFQSATAAGLLVSGLAGQQIITVTSGMVALLGADLGSAVAVRLLALDLQLLIPVFILAGTGSFMVSDNRTSRQAGRILVGLGLLFLALRLIGEASAPLRESRLLPAVIGPLSDDAALAFLLAAALTWLMHSSIAAILLIATLVRQSVVPVDLGLDLMLGTNLGGALIAAGLTRGAVADQKAVTLANLIVRGLGAAAAAILIARHVPPLERLSADPATRIILAHIAFNTVILLAGALVAPWVAGLARRLAGRRGASGNLLDAQAASALDEAALSFPRQAIANATREVLRLTEDIDVMLARIIDLYRNAETDDMKSLGRLDDRVDRRHAAIKLYLARATASDVSEREAIACQELIAACVKLEQVGDIIVRNMLTHVQKMRDRKLEFSPEGWSELRAIHAAVLANARLAFNVLVSRDTATARRLVEEKDRMRELERDAGLKHFERLRHGTPATVESSSIHLDTIRDLKEINALLASLAYPVLEEQGLLSGSRLKKTG